jgi:hypothetical protein
MFQRVQQSIAIAVLAGYLLTVTGAAPLHRCRTDLAGTTRLPETGACTHCHASGDACEVRTSAGKMPATCAEAADAEASHCEADCFVCQVLAQKCLPITGPGTIGRGEVTREPLVAEPRPAAGTLVLSWHSRAPPRAA